MLRQALDAAKEEEEHHQQQDEQQSQHSGSETTSLATRPEDYGSILMDESLAKTTSEADDSVGASTFGDEDDDDVDEDDAAPDESNFLWKGVRAIYNLTLLIANVDNLWDSPTHRRTNRTWFVVLFWFTMLASGYAVERTTFKLLVDRTGPFRLFSAVVLTATHALLLSLGMLLSNMVNKSWDRIKGLGIPIVDVGFMALLDTIHLLLVVISGSHIPPTLIVILVQLTIPLTGLFSQFFHPDGCCTFAPPPVATADCEEGSQTSQNYGTTVLRPPISGCGGMASEHVIGSLLITISVLASLVPAIISFFEPQIFVAMDVLPIRTALNTMLFTVACIPAAASQLYKEHVFLSHKQPVDANKFNLLLSVFQFFFLLIVSPLVYILQGLGIRGDWTSMYPSAQISANFADGMKCFLGTLSEEDQESAYPEDATCDYSMAIVVAHVMSIIIIGVAVDKIVNAGATKIMYRGISAGIILAVVALYTYDIHDPDFNYGPVIDSLHFMCTLTLILGSEVYHRVSLQDATFETIYAEIENLYDEDDL